MKKKLLSLALALVMCLGLTVPAFAEDWEDATEVNDYEEFAAALADDAVEEIKIVGEVTIPKADTAIETGKSILVGKDGKLTFAAGAVLISTADMGKFWFEDSESTWQLVSEMCETFALYADGDSIYREIYGTQPDINTIIKNTSHGAISTLSFSGADVDLTENFDGGVFDVRGGHSLTIAKDVSLKASTLFNVEGDLGMSEGAKLEIPDDNSVDGKAVFAEEAQQPENINVKGEVVVAGGTGSAEPAEPVAPAAPKFTDVAADSPFAAAIDWAVAQGITNGTTDTTFSPSNTCTVANILTFLWRAEGEPDAENAEIAAGIAETSYYYTAAQWAANLGMIDSANVLSQPCTRSMAVYFIWCANGGDEVETEVNFTDVDADADYAAAVAWAVENKVTTGTTTTTFAPDNTCTRGQIVTFLYRADQAKAA